MNNFKIILVFFIFFVAPAFAYDIHPQVKKEFLAAGGNPKAFSHLACILKHKEGKRLRTKKANPFPERCNYLESGTNLISINNFKYAVIVEYTQTSNNRRLFLINLDQRSNQTIEKYYVSHGRSRGKKGLKSEELTPRTNRNGTKYCNTINKLKCYNNYFDATRGAAASPSGFFVTGIRYVGNHKRAPEDPQSVERKSLLLHGIDKDINDNSCRRLVVLHGNQYIREGSKGGYSKGVNLMSSGCYMVDFNQVDQIVEKIRGSGEWQKYQNGGSVFFVHGSREQTLSSNHYCK